MCLAVPGRVLALHARGEVPMARADFGGVCKDVCLSYLPEVRVGDWVAAHLGFAMQRMDEESARATMAAFAALGLHDEDFQAGFAAAAGDQPGPGDGTVHRS